MCVHVAAAEAIETTPEQPHPPHTSTLNQRSAPSAPAQAVEADQSAMSAAQPPVLPVPNPSTPVQAAQSEVIDASELSSKATRTLIRRVIDEVCKNIQQGSASLASAQTPPPPLTIQTHMGQPQEELQQTERGRRLRGPRHEDQEKTAVTHKDEQLTEGASVTPPPSRPSAARP